MLSVYLFSLATAMASNSVSPPAGLSGTCNDNASHMDDGAALLQAQMTDMVAKQGQENNEGKDHARATRRRRRRRRRRKSGRRRAMPDCPIPDNFDPIIERQLEKEVDDFAISLFSAVRSAVQLGDSYCQVIEQYIYPSITQPTVAQIVRGWWPLPWCPQYSKCRPALLSSCCCTAEVQQCQSSGQALPRSGDISFQSCTECVANRQEGDWPSWFKLRGGFGRSNSRVYGSGQRYRQKYAFYVDGARYPGTPQNRWRRLFGDLQNAPVV
eukprot:TRINITY_DN48347_c0_g1_i1.p1 TRINITY_DN48347_c0_g1~~TRINITY_DN48347_c0_g1_i1.p1  ORF type:complete len:269 (+),score=25.85 TRINITY_DN48347_c0_g1_i1:57-863(+)